MLLHNPPPHFRFAKMKDRAARNLMGLLDRIDALGQDVSGAFLVHSGKQAYGAVHIDHGQLCWATARGMERRLTDLLCDASEALTRESLQLLWRQCRHDKLPLTRVLLESKRIEAGALQRAMLTHTAECLLKLGPKLHEDLPWESQPVGTYQAMFALATRDVARTAGALLHGAQQELARAELAHVVPNGCVGAAYALSHPTDTSGSWHATLECFPVETLWTPERSLSSLIDLGRWARQQLDTARALGHPPKAVVGISEAGQALVSWAYAAGCCAAVCDNTSELARLLSGHHRRHGNGSAALTASRQ